MIFFKFLLRGSWFTIVLSGFIGLIAGVSGIALLHLVRHSIRGGKHDALPANAVIYGFPLLYLFIGLCVVMLISRALSQYIMTRFTQKTVSKLRRHLCRETLRVPLRALEIFGTQRVQKILTKDVSTIGRAMNVIPILCIKTTLIVCGLGYFAWLSPKLFGALAAFAVGGYLVYAIASRRTRKLMRQSRQDQKALTRHVHQLIRGLKELKLHRPRQDAFLDKGIDAADDSLGRHNINGAKIYALTSTLGRLLCLAAIGLLLFYWPTIEPIDGRDLFIFGFILILTMRLGGSVAAGFNLLFNKARAATRRLQKLGITVGEFEEEGSLLAGETLDPNWARLEFAGVMHSYRNTFGALADDDDTDDDAADDPNADPTEARAAVNDADIDTTAEMPSREGENNDFVLGPIDLTLRAGEITFVVGGNGSGKSTLLKLLSGLYYPESGEIRLDGQAIDVRRREAYRQLFSGVFDEAVLFENLWGIEPYQVDEHARQYLQAFQLDREVTVVDGKFSTTETLSIGQRKRLALVASYLEDRPIYVFDEWAANQDPLFKGVFYKQILPDLKARGRTVVAVTHDDNYFDVADRIVILRDGKIVEGNWRDHLAQRGCAVEVIDVGLNGQAIPPATTAANEAKSGAG